MLSYTIEHPRCEYRTVKRRLRLAGGPTSHILPAIQPCNHEGKHASPTREIIQIICGQDSQRENLFFSIGLPTSSTHFPSRIHTLYRLELNDQDGTLREKIPQDWRPHRHLAPSIATKSAMPPAWGYPKF